MKKIIFAILLLVLAVGFSLTARPAFAIPELQLYIEGSTYDSSTETWVIDSATPFTLWVIANVQQKGPIYGVKLSAAFQTAESGGSVTLTPTTATLVTDPSTPSSPTPTGNFPSADGAVPVKGDGSHVAEHDIFKPGISFFEWDIGDFTSRDSPVGDFIDTYPSEFPVTGQINAYTVTVSGISQLHFDSYNHTVQVTRRSTRTDYWFAPFSHDANATVPNPCEGGDCSTGTPEPGVILILGAGLVALVLLRFRQT